MPKQSKDPRLVALDEMELGKIQRHLDILVEELDHLLHVCRRIKDMPTPEERMFDAVMDEIHKEKSKEKPKP